jgi:hypothetical protein
VYIKNYLRLKISALHQLIALYFLVSALGVANELSEFVFTQAGVINLNPSDTWWDLMANTSGAIVFWLGYVIYESSTSQK